MMRAAKIILVTAALSALQVLTPAQQAVLDGWFMCADCRDADFLAVRQVVSADSLAALDSLSSAMTQGISPDWRLRLRNRLIAAYPGSPAAATVPMDTFVTREMAKIEVLWRYRATMALGAIRTPRTLSALDSALALPLPQVVLIAIRRAKADSLPIPP